MNGRAPALPVDPLKQEQAGAFPQSRRKAEPRANQKEGAERGARRGQFCPNVTRWHGEQANTITRPAELPGHKSKPPCERLLLTRGSAHLFQLLAQAESCCFSFWRVDQVIQLAGILLPVI